MKAKTATATSPARDRRRSRTQKASTKRPPSKIGAVYYVSAALAVIAFVVYANSLANEFVFDDRHLVLGSRRWLNLENTVKLLLSYRPVRNISYAIDLAVWGERPFGFHLTSVLIHAGATVLVFLLVRRLTERILPSFFTALIFAVHPIQTDAVAYISGRRDVLFGLFYVGAFLSYLTYRTRNSKLFYILFLALWALSLMSKEMAVSLPMVILLWNFCDVWNEGSGSRVSQLLTAIRKALARDKLLYAALVVSAGAYVSFMIFVQGSTGRVSGEGIHYWGGSFWANTLTAVRVHGWYLKQLIWPTPIAQYYGAFGISYSLLDWRVLLSLASVLALLAWAFTLLKEHRLMAFAIFSYFALLLPVSQIVPHHELVADHYLYLPMMSFGLLLSLLIERLARMGVRQRKVAYATAALIALLFGALTVRRNQDWRNEFTVWAANYEAAPNSPRAAHNLGGMYLRANPQRAEELFKQALAADPTFEAAYLSLARLYVTQKRIPEAEELIQKGLALTDTQEGSFILRNSSLVRSQLTTVLAAAKWEANERDQTEQLLRQAAAQYPGNWEAFEALANLYHGKDPAREVDVLRQGAANVFHYEPYARLSSVLIEEKRYDEAASYLRLMLGMTPGTDDCLKAGSYLTSSRAAVGRAMELREINELLLTLIAKCGS
jgi:tetratricopeptide (TPR) repeat protein